VRNVRRLLKVVLVLVVLVVLAVGGLMGWVTWRAFPQTSGSLEVAGLVAPVTVLRDDAGIARITADNRHDLFLAQGYIHAGERMWQMEVWRHISAGRLSELFGKSQIDTDKFIRTLNWRGAAQRDLDDLPPDVRADVDAYVEGVNAWLDAHRGGLGMAFVVTGMQNGTGGLGGYDPEPWTALDTIAWQKVQAWQLGGNFDVEAFRMLADEHLGDPARTDELFPAYRADRPVITPTGLAGSGGAGSTLPAGVQAMVAAAPRGHSRADRASTPRPSLTPAQADAWRRVAGLGSKALAVAGLDAGGGIASDQGLGSNNWVVAPDLSTTGGALFANDPHLGIGMPSVWFMNGLHCRVVDAGCPFDVVGVSFPGTPGVVLGHNARIAWGATNVDPDVQDLFLEELDPTDPTHYLFRGESLPLSVRHEEIKVAGGAPVVIDVRETNHGPIVNDVDPRLKDAPPLALRWTATAMPDGTFEAVSRIQIAKDFEEFRAALSHYGSPSQNFLYADVDGHIGYVLPGTIPVRADPDDRGERPRDGGDGEHEWTGTIPFDDLPWQLDPAAGMIVTANNAPVDDRYPGFIGEDWDPGYRATRIHELLETAVETGGVTADELRAIQGDTTMLRAGLVTPRLAGIAPTTADGRAVRDMTLAWKGACGADNPGCATYSAFEYELERALFDDDLGPELAREYVGSSRSWEALIALLDEPDSAWWDDTTTADRHETRDDILAAALDRTGAQMRAAWGAPDTWTWGKMHRATFAEATLGTSGIGPLEWYFNEGPISVGGAAGTIDNNYYRPGRAYPDPNDPDYVPVGIAGVFDVTTLPSYRLSIDMTDLDGARIVQTTGQSGNPFDRHYGDLIDEWGSNQTLPLPWDRAKVDAAAVSRLELTP
jgi:penicillin amidase